MAKVGLLLVGASGAIGSTIACGLHVNKSRSHLLGQGMVTTISPANRLPLQDIDDFVLGGWDTTPSTPYETIKQYRVLDGFETLGLTQTTPPIPLSEAIVLPSDHRHIVDGRECTNLSHREATEFLKESIETFRRENNVKDIVVVNLSSPGAIVSVPEISDREAFERAVTENSSCISSNVLYCLAALESGCAYVDFTPSDVFDWLCLDSIACDHGVPIAGRDGSTGQTLMKSILADMFRQRHLRINSWYSTNVLGNNDGRVLSDARFARNKMKDKGQVLSTIVDEDVEQLIRIDYLPHKGDNKEAWDSIEFSGWLNELMTVKINWIGKDSILAAPLVLDLARMLCYSLRLGHRGLQSHLGVFFKCPMGTAERRFFRLARVFDDYCINQAGTK